ncbi:MAG: hypothetical protein AB7T06_39815 [Kofleriaceae bacterium]
MHLRTLALVALLSLAPACSFFRANCVNDPQGTCSSKTVIFDYTVAGVAAAGGTAIYLAVPCDIEARDCNQLDALTRIVVPAVVLGVTSLASAIYGGSVVDRCERLQKRSRRR